MEEWEDFRYIDASISTGSLASSEKSLLTRSSESSSIVDGFQGGNKKKNKSGLKLDGIELIRLQNGQSSAAAAVRKCVEFVDEKLHQLVASDGSRANATIITTSLGEGNYNLSSLDDDVWEVLQSQFEKTQGLNIPLDGSSLEQSSQITHIQYYQNGNGKENFASQGNGKHKPTQFITNGAHSGNGQNGSTSSNGNKTVMDINADESDNGVGLCGWLLTTISWGLVMVTLPFSLCVCFKVVQEYERAVIFRLGRLLHGGSRGPGIFFVLPCIESYQKVDLRTITLSVPPQEVLTKDSVTVSVDAVVYYRVSNATVSVANVENAHHSTRLLAQTTLRNILGTKNLHEILSDRESISGSMQVVLDEATTAWGIKVERVEIKDARLPVQLQRAMAAEAEAAREARAKVIAAEGEQKASRALKEASEVIAESSSALQLRYLQTLNSISAEKNSTIIFPLPIDFISHFLKDKDDKNGKAD
jgi:erythrocyte band 7 integral membrane protein